MLTVRQELPDALLECGPREVHDILGGPTLCHLPGRSGRPLFVSVLLHGNEITGLLAMQRVLKYYRHRELPRPLSLFVGNTRAAAAGKRLVEGQPDYNRIWGTGDGPEQRMTLDVMEHMRRLDPVGCIDIHNNTGRNPLYTVVARRDRAHLSLASRFSRTVVYATQPDTTCATSFSALCPSVTAESGLPGEPAGVDAVVRYVSDSLELPDPIHHVEFDVDLFHTVAVVKVAPQCTCGVAGEDADFELDPTVERFNFKEVPPGTVLGRVRGGRPDCVEIQPFETTAARTWLQVQGGELTVARTLMPAMLTSDPEVVKWDCLCYVMERLQ
ncbi:MAG: M14 family metallopeptidase [Arenicellales bacterium]